MHHGRANLAVPFLAFVATLSGCGGNDGSPPGGNIDGGVDAAPGSADAAVADAGIPEGKRVTLVWIGTGAYDPSARGRIEQGTFASDALTAGTGLVAGSLPSWIAMAPDGRHAYAVDENNSRILAYAVTPRTGVLTEIGAAVESGGTGPVHLVVDHTGRWLIVANYTSGTVSVLRLEADGSVRKGAVDTETTGKYTHQIALDPSNRFVLVPCVGDNHVAQLRFDPEKGTLDVNAAPVISKAGAGPRHLAFHPDGRHAYTVDELSSTVTAYDWNALDGTLLRRDGIRAIPDEFPDKDNTGAEIVIGAGGRFVYSSNRGHDSIAVFKVGNGGALSLVARTPTGGDVPRSMALAPGGDRLIVANQASKEVWSFAIDATAGTLSSPKRLIQTSASAFFVGVYAIAAE